MTSILPFKKIIPNYIVPHNFVREIG